MQSDNVRGAIFMLLALTAFVSNDTVMKYIATDLNLGQLIIVRGMFATSILLAIIHFKKLWHHFPRIFDKWVIIRALTEMFANLFFFAGLLYIEIGNAHAIMQAIPLVVTMGAALFFAEKVGWRRWSAISVGFLGVLLIIRPGLEGFTPYSLFLIGAVLLASSRDLLTRKIDNTIPSTLINLVTTFCVMIGGFIIIMPMGGPETMDGTQVGLSILAAILISIAGQMVIYAMRYGDISFVAPFRYSGLLIAIVLGFIVFGEIPDLLMILGSTIIIASGIYMFHREKKVSKTLTASKTNPTR